MKISSVSNTSRFDSALDHLDWIEKTLKFQLDFDIWKLKMGISLLKTFDLYIRRCRRRRSNQFMCLEYDKEENGDAKSDSSRLAVFRSGFKIWLGG